MQAVGIQSAAVLHINDSLTLLLNLAFVGVRQLSTKTKLMSQNYQPEFTVDDVARLLKIEKVKVEEWSQIFAEFLSSESKLIDGPLLFSASDLAVLEYVVVYSKVEPDIESIKFNIHAQEHLKFPFYESVQRAGPIFKRASDDIEEIELEQTTSFGGPFNFSDLHELAKAYKRAGDILTDKAIDDHQGYELIFPMIYNYRHATELFLKSALRISEEELKKLIGHNLIKATHLLEIRIRNEYGEGFPDWFKDVIKAFNDFDKNGETFRYGKLQIENEMLVDLNNLKQKMTWLEETFDRLSDLHN